MELNPLKWFSHKKDSEKRGQSRGPQFKYPENFDSEDVQEVERLARGFASSNLSEDAKRENQKTFKELASRLGMTEGELMIYVRNASIAHEAQRRHGELGEKLINSLGALSEMNIYNAIKGNLPEWLEENFPVLSRVAAKSASARTLVTAGVVFGGGVASATIGIPVLGLAVATATSAVAGYDFARRLSRTAAKEKFEDYRRFLDGINVDERDNTLIESNPSTENEEGEIEPLRSIVKRMAEQLIQGGHRFGEALGLTADGQIDLNSQEAKLLLAYEKIIALEADEEKLQKEIFKSTDPDRALLRIAHTDDAVEADFQRLLITKRTEGMQRVMNALRANQKKEKVHGALGAVAGGMLGNVARAFGAVAFRGMTLEEYVRSMFSVSWLKGEPPSIDHISRDEVARSFGGGFEIPMEGDMRNHIDLRSVKPGGTLHVGIGVLEHGNVPLTPENIDKFSSWALTPNEPKTAIFYVSPEFDKNYRIEPPTYADAKKTSYDVYKVVLVDAKTNQRVVHDPFLKSANGKTFFLDENFKWHDITEQVKKVADATPTAPPAATPEPTAPPAATPEPTAPPAEPTVAPAAKAEVAVQTEGKPATQPRATEMISPVYGKMPEDWAMLKFLGQHLSDEVQRSLNSARAGAFPVNERGALLNVLYNLKEKGLIAMEGDRVVLKVDEPTLERMYTESHARPHTTADAYGKKINLSHWKEWFGSEEQRPIGARPGAHAERTSARNAPSEPRMPRSARVVPESGTYAKGVRADAQVLSDTRPGKIKPGVILRPEEIAYQEEIAKGLSQREQEVITEQNARRTRSVQPAVREVPPASKPPEAVSVHPSVESLRFTSEARIGEAMLNQRLKFYNNLDKYLTENYAPFARTPSEEHGLLLREDGKNLVVNEALHAELMKQGRTEEAMGVAREMARSVTSIAEKYGREIINPTFLPDAVKAQIDFDKLPTLRDVLKLAPSTPWDAVQDATRQIGKMLEGGVAESAPESAAVQPGETSAAPKGAQTSVAEPATPAGEAPAKGGAPTAGEEAQGEKGEVAAAQKEAPKLSPEELAQQAYQNMQDALYKKHGINPQLVDYTQSLRVSYFLDKIQEIAAGKATPNAIFGSGADQYSMKDWEKLSKYIADHEPTAGEKRMVLKNYLLSKEK